MPKNNPYNILSEYVLRTPLLPFSFFQELTKSEHITDQALYDAVNDKIIVEALYLASPSLYSEIQKWKKEELTDLKEIKRLKFSILKYLSRMASRCTPFGMFAGCSVGEIKEAPDSP